MPHRYRSNPAHEFRKWLGVVMLAAIVWTGCGHKKKTKSPPSAPQAHAARTPAIPAPVGSVEEGLASWYGPPYHGRQAADGEIYDMEKLTAAHRTLPFQTWVRVTNLANGLTVEVRITDRGPFVEGRIIDLSKAAARQIQLLGPGVGPVRLEVIYAPPPATPSAAIVARAAQPRSATNPEPAAPAPPPVPTSPELPPLSPPGAPPRLPVILPPDTIGGRNLYAVQVGVFANYENAVRLRDLYSKDYGPAQLVMRQGLPATWRVLVGSFENETEAQRLAERIHSEHTQAVFVVHLDPPPPATATAPNGSPSVAPPAAVPPASSGSPRQ